ncbi:hypothetical protein HNP46_000292 [Pseudomonas nitritireducens]|uniref:Uncharacterized protein n=1 Tax=Pseudomonas nitroreducens TaxID=46680 RepID=A0A7W7KFH6_PSENT|nr:hypothetical protein [Pseudomonas nitritireducens]MBB4861481.1 hypothetical protein [Pseudomonas nitritireducens]
MIPLYSRLYGLTPCEISRLEHVRDVFYSKPHLKNLHGYITYLLTHHVQALTTPALSTILTKASLFRIASHSMLIVKDVPVALDGEIRFLHLCDYLSAPTDLPPYLKFQDGVWSVQKDYYDLLRHHTDDNLPATTLSSLAEAAMGPSGPIKTDLPNCLIRFEGALAYAHLLDMNVQSNLSALLNDYLARHFTLRDLQNADDPAEQNEFLAA